MSFDPLIIDCLLEDLNSRLPGARLSKIYQVGRTDIIIHLHRDGSNWKLLLSAHPAMPRLHLTQRAFDYPPNPTPFCMLLRRYLVGGTVALFRQPPLERVVHLRIANLDPRGYYGNKELVCELIGRHSNIILLSEPVGDREPQPVILGALKSVTPLMSRRRRIQAGLPYEPPPPPPGKINPLALSAAQFVDALRPALGTGRPLDKLIVDTFAGISPALARRLTGSAAAGGDGRAAGACLARLEENFADLLATYRQKKYRPAIVYADEQQLEPRYFHVWPAATDNARLAAAGEINEMLDAFFRAREEAESAKQLRQLVQATVRQALERLSHKKQKQEQELRQAEEYATYRLWGELLLANLSRVAAGLTQVLLPNYYEDGQTVTIPLDPSLTPAQNAQRLFHRYQKGKKSRTIIRRQLQQTENELTYMQSIAEAAGRADLAVLREIVQELEQAGYLKAHAGTARKGAPAPSRPLKFLSSEGDEIFVGRNNRQNEQLTFRLAGKNDIWLHVKDAPGAHVILKKDWPRELPADSPSLIEAAMLAAGFSRAATSSNVPVDFTLVQHVKKIPGAKPGMVTYQKHKTLFVTPDAELCRRLAVNQPDR